MRVDVGDERAGTQEFEQVFARHAAFACRVLRRFGVAESDLADACQDAFLVVHRKLPEFEGRAAVSSWLYRICARVASDYRKRAHRRYETEALAREPAVAAPQGREVELHERIALLQRALAALDDGKRQVFVLYELEELSMAEVAELLGCPQKTAFARLYAARARINAALARAGCAALIVPLIPTRLRELADPQLLRALDAALDGAVHPGPLAPSAASVAPGASHGAHWALGALGALTAAMLATSGAVHAPERGAMLASTPPPARLDAGRALPLPLERVLAPATTKPSAQPARAARRKRPTPARAVEPLPTPAAATQATHVGDWIEPPDVVPPTADAPAPAPSVGLDEVLAATSIRQLLRPGPPERAERWALVPRARR